MVKFTRLKYTYETLKRVLSHTGKLMNIINCTGLITVWAYTEFFKGFTNVKLDK